MISLKELKIQLYFYSRFLIILLPNRIYLSSCDANWLSSLLLNEFTEWTVMTEKSRLFHALVILTLNKYFLRLLWHIRLFLMNHNNKCWHGMDVRSRWASWSINYQVQVLPPVQRQESPAITDKPARRESLPKIAPIRRATKLSLTILAYLHSFSCCCVRNLRNPAKFTENSNLWSSRSSKAIDLGVNR